MYRRLLVPLGILAIACAGPSRAIVNADDSSPPEQRQQHHSSHDRASAERQSQNDSDQDDLEYRGMEHAALGVLLGEREGQGVRIRDVLPDSPAAQVGLMRNDRITKIDDRPINSYRDVIRYVNRVKPEQTGTVTVSRNGAEKTVKVTFAPRDQVYENEQQDDQQFSQARDTRDSGREYGDRRPTWNDQRGDQNRAVLGVDLAENKTQAVIREVKTRGAAQSAGLRAGDELIAIDDQTISNKDDLRNQLRNHRPGDQVNLTYRREGREQTASAQLGSSYALTGQGGNDHARMQNRLAGKSGYQRWSISEHHPALGVTLDEDHQGTLSISRVIEGGPADKAGVQHGDELLGIDNQDVDSVRDVMRQISHMQPGDTVTLHLRRDGKKQDVKATLRPSDEVFDDRTAARPDQRDNRPRNGSSDNNRSVEENRGANHDQQRRDSNPGID